MQFILIISFNCCILSFINFLSLKYIQLTDMPKHALSIKIKLLALLAIFFPLAANQEIIIKTQTQILAPSINDQYNVVFASIYPQDNQSNNPKSQTKNSDNSKQIDFNPEKYGEVKPITIIASAPKVTKIKDYFAVIDVYPELQKMLNQATEILQQTPVKTVNSPANQNVPITAKDIRSNSIPHSQESPHQLPRAHQLMLTKTQAIFVIAAIGFVVMVGLIVVMRRRSNKKEEWGRMRESLDRLQREREEDEDEEEASINQLRGDIIAVDDLPNFD